MFTLSEIQCAAGIRLLKKLINLTLYGFKGQKKAIKIMVIIKRIII